MSAPLTLAIDRPDEHAPQHGRRMQPAGTSRIVLPTAGKLARRNAEPPLQFRVSTDIPLPFP